jgi:hypothetical protein
MPDPVVELDLPVVRLDLRREHVEAEAEPFDELAGDGGPVDGGVGGEVGGPRACRARELGQVLAGFDLVGHARQPPREDAELFAHRGRSGGLAVGARQHRGVAVLHGEIGERCDHGAQLGKPHALDRALHGERVRRGVDVFAGAREVGQFGDGVESQFRQAIADQVLDGLHIVAGHGLFLGQPVDLGLAELEVQRSQPRLVVVAEGRGAEQRPVGEGDQPLDLYLDARAVQSGLGEIVGEPCYRGAVPPVEGAEGLPGKSGGMERGHGTPVETRGRTRRHVAGRIAGSSCRKSARLALSIIPSTSSNIPGPA